MQKPVSSWSALKRTGLLLAVGAASGCGGGGGSEAPAPSPGVSALAVANPKYSQQATFTVTGTGLNQLSLAVASPACRAAPVATGTATATQATFSCVVGTVGATNVTVSVGGTVAQTVAYTVPKPQVTLTVAGGAAGSIVIELEPGLAPVTVDNFLGYVASGFYVNTLFHRTVPGFVAQGGGYTAVRPSAALKTTGAPIVREIAAGLSHTQWTIGMARGPAADSATSQFFINVGDNSGSLDGAYAVFGRVVTGTSVAAAIVNASCAALPAIGSECAPLTDITITTATQTL